MRILLAIISFALAALFLSYVGFVVYNLSTSLYEVYPIDLSDIVVDKRIYTLLFLTVGSLALGAAFVVGGIVLLSKQPQRQH